MFITLYIYLTSICLGIHSLFEEGMLFDRWGVRLAEWAKEPRDRELKKLLSDGDLNGVNKTSAIAKVKHRRTGRELLLKPMFTCVGCMSGIYGLGLFLLLCALGGQPCSEFVATHWMDGLTAILLCVFTNRLFWGIWERIKQ